jgi:IS5 family transposase
VIELSRPQLSFAEGLIQEEVGPLWEEWMRQVDEVLLDPELLSIVYEALARRWPKSRTRGRPGTPADVVLRLLLLKHIRNWSYCVLEREGARELGVSAVHAGGRGESTRCQDTG